MKHFTPCLLSPFEHCDRVRQMTEWVCRWKPFWIPSGDTFQKASLEEWKRVDDGQSHVSSEDKAHRTSRTTESAKLQAAGRDERTTTREPPCDVSSLPKSSWQAVGESDARSWKHTGPQEIAVFWEPLAARLPPKNRVCNFFIQSNSALFPNDKYCRILTKRFYPVMIFRHR